MAYVDVGSYVEFISSVDSRCYGRVTSSRMGTNNSSMLMINQFVELEKINAMLMNDENIPALRNRYVDVIAKLAQTNHFLEVNSAAVTKIIFVFKKDEVVSGNYLCKGMAHAFIIWYRIGTRQFTLIPNNECLPFPCNYPNSPTCVSYSKQIYSGIYDIRQAIIRSICQNSEKIGRQFIVGSTSFKFPLETWIFIVDYCKKTACPCTDLSRRTESIFR